MSVPIHCKHCGYDGTSRRFSMANSKGASVKGNFESCPRCGGLAELQDGVYDFVGDIIAAFRNPDITRQDVESVRKIIADAAKGKITAEAAVDQTANILGSLALVLKVAHERGITFDRILAVILALHAVWNSYTSNNDVQSALSESRTQTQIAQKALLETKAQRELTQKLVDRNELQQRSNTHVKSVQNRAERRKAASIQRRKSNSKKI